MKDHRTIVGEFMERVWNRGDLDSIDTLIAPAYTIHGDPGDPWDGQTLDREGFRRRLIESKAPFPDLRFHPGEFVAEGERVVVSWTLTATHRGELAGIPATGRPIEIAGMTIYYLEDGRITGHRQVVDRLAVLQQIGALGPPPA